MVVILLQLWFRKCAIESKREDLPGLGHTGEHRAVLPTLMGTSAFSWGKNSTLPGASDFPSHCYHSVIAQKPFFQFTKMQLPNTNSA